MIHVLVAMAFAQDPVLVLQTARIPLPVGHVLRASDMVELRMPGRDIPLGVVQDPSTVVGREIKVPVFPGEVLRGEYLGRSTDKPPSLVPPGHFAVQIPVKSDAADLAVVVLHPGGFCQAVQGVQPIVAALDLVAIPAKSAEDALKALVGDASVRRADPGLRPCR